MIYKELLDKIKEFEGFRSKRYLDSVGVLTIGYGFTSTCFPNKQVPNEISEEVAEKILSQKVDEVMKKVKVLLQSYGYSFSENTDIVYALTDFTYNCGLPNLRKLTRGGLRNIDEITEKITAYNKAGGKELRGLTKRRLWEQEIIKNAMNKNPDIKVISVKTIQRELNNLYGYNLKIDGITGPKTLNAIYEVIIKKKH